MLITFVGGDARMVAVARLFAATRASVRTFGLGEEAPCPVTTLYGAVAEAGAVVLPLPVTRDGIRPPASDGHTVLPPFDAIFSRADAEALFFGGLVPPAVHACAAEAGISLFDYYTAPRLVTRNAGATAETAVALATLALPVTLEEAPVAVIGYGRIGRGLVARLVPLGARVTVVTRSPEGRAAARAAGAPVALPPDETGACPLTRDTRVVFQTAPAPFSVTGGYAALAPGTLLYDIAGGTVARAEAEAAGLLLPPSAGLPGRYAPESAGRYIFEEIRDSILEQRGIQL